MGTTGEQLAGPLRRLISVDTFTAWRPTAPMIMGWRDAGAPVDREAQTMVTAAAVTNPRWAATNAATPARVIA